MSFFDFIGDSLKGVNKSLQEGKASVLASSEKVLRVQRLKSQVEVKRQEKDDKMMELAHRVYELYSQNKLQDPQLLEVCQNVKSLKWQIDEAWTEINHLENS